MKMKYDDTMQWTEVSSTDQNPIFSRLTPLRGYPAALPESFLTGHQGRGFVHIEARYAAVLTFDFLFATCPDPIAESDSELELFGHAVGALIEQLLESGEYNAVHLLPPLAGQALIAPGSSSFFAGINRSDFSWHQYVRMYFIGNAADHRSDELVRQGFPFTEAEVELPDDRPVVIRAFCGTDLTASADEEDSRPRSSKTCGASVDLEEVASESWSRDLVEAMGGIHRYRRQGLGVFLYDGDELICGASSFCRYPNAIEVEVDTRPDRRNAGLARWAGAALSVLAAAHDMYLCWDAAHPSSARIAMDLGLGFSGHYICTVYRFADPSRRSAEGVDH
jgi:hypothetical protein